MPPDHDDEYTVDANQEPASAVVDQHIPTESSTRLRWGLRQRKTRTHRQETIEIKVGTVDESNFNIFTCAEKGRSVQASKKFFAGDLLLQYIGELLTGSEGFDREKVYGDRGDAHCYIYYFRHREQLFCIDATNEDGKLGRLVNHSRKNPNAVPKVFVIRDEPQIYLMAKRDIEALEEITYDYGERRRNVLSRNPWLIHS
jgi:histone-lysine N-methyltransferase SETD8